MKVFLEAFDSDKPGHLQHPLRTHRDYADIDNLPLRVTDEFGFTYERGEEPEWDGYILFHHIGNDAGTGTDVLCTVEPFIISGAEWLRRHDGSGEDGIGEEWKSA
jgi:hypothetical protein